MKSKKLLFVLVAALLSSATLFSQDKKFSWGPKVALNVSGITNSDMSSWRTGVSAGMFFSTRCNDYFGMQSELLFSMMGANYKNGNIKLNYITMPVLAKVYVLKDLSVELGPQLGVKVYDDVTVFHNIDFRHTKAFNPVELAFVVGLGYEFDFGLITDVRYMIGLTNSIKNSYSWGDNSKNEAFQISVGWKF